MNCFWFLFKHRRGFIKKLNLIFFIFELKEPSLNKKSSVLNALELLKLFIYSTVEKTRHL